MSPRPGPVRRSRETLEDLGHLFRRSRGARWGAIALGAVALLTGVALLVPLPGESCGVLAAESCAPKDDAIGFVPADAYAYAHLDLDPGSGQYRQARELLGRLPHLAAITQGVFQILGPGQRLDLARDVNPWLGDEAAAAILPGPDGSPQPLLAFSVSDPRRARAFLGRLYSFSRLASEIDGGFLLLGTPDAVKASERAIRTGESLATAGEAADLRGGLPADRLGDVYVSAAGIGALLAAGGGGLASPLDALTDLGASRGIAGALVARPDGLQFDLVSSLDPKAAAAHPSLLSDLPDFEPSLAREFAPDTLAMVEAGRVSGPARGLPALAAAALPGIAAAFRRIDAGLRRDGDPGLAESLLPLLGGEAALAVTPSAHAPYVTLAFDGVDSARARAVLARLEGPVSAALRAGSGAAAPAFSSRAVGDVIVRSVRISPAIALSYAVDGGRLVLSTSAQGVVQAIRGRRHLAGTESYRRAENATVGGVSALGFLNLDELVKLAEPRGLAEIASDFSTDLARLKALSLFVGSTPDSLKTTIFLEIK